MKKLIPLLLLGLPLPALAGQDTHQQLVDQFMAVIPQLDEEEPQPPVLDAAGQERLDGLAKRYPAKKAQIGTILLDRVRCSDAGSEGMAEEMVRKVADSLTDDELRAMIAFHTGPDRDKMEGLDEDSPEAQALFAKYPVQRFYEATQAQAATMIEMVFEKEIKCDEATDAAFAAIGVAE